MYKTLMLRISQVLDRNINSFQNSNLVGQDVAHKQFYTLLQLDNPTSQMKHDY